MEKNHILSLKVFKIKNRHDVKRLKNKQKMQITNGVSKNANATIQQIAHQELQVEKQNIKE